MKTLFLAFINADYPQILHKFSQQYHAFKKVNSNTSALVIGKGQHPQQQFACIDINNIYTNPPYLLGKQIAVDIALQQISKLKPDIIYCRYPLADEFTYKLANSGAPLVWELQTLAGPEFELQNNQLLADNEQKWAPKLMHAAAGIVGVTGQISDYYQSLAPGKATLTLANGIDTQAVPQVSPSASQPLQICMACADFNQPWQGIDRILAGAARSKNKNYHLHLIGGYQPGLKKAISKAGLDNQVTLHGWLNPGAMWQIIKNCAVGIGPLAIHRKNLTQACALKLRQYTAVGLPFVYAGDDPDFNLSQPYVLEASLNDDPINWDELLNFAQDAIITPAWGQQLRQLAQQQLDMPVKMAKLHTFLQTLTGNSAAKSTLKAVTTRTPAIPTQQQSVYPNPFDFEPPTPALFNRALIISLATQLKLSPGNQQLATQLMQTLLQPVATVAVEDCPVKVSVVIPYYKQPQTIAATLLSVLHQSWLNLEIIIINDGDDEQELLEQITPLCNAYPHIDVHYWATPNSGLAATRNFAITKSSGDFILPLDADDLLAADFVKQAASYLVKHQNIDFVYTEALFFGAKNEVWAQLDYDPLLLTHMNLMTCTTMYRRQVFDTCQGYNTAMTNGYEDWDFWLKAAEAGFSAARIALPLFMYRRKQDSMLERRTSYDAAAKLQIVNQHPGIYRQPGSADRHLFGKEIGRIPAELLTPNALDLKDKYLQRLKPQTKQATKQKPTSQLPTKRVLFTVHDFPPYKYAGAQLYALNLAKELLLLGWEVGVFYPVNISDRKAGEPTEPFALTTGEFEGLKVFQVNVNERDKRVLDCNPQYAYDVPEVEEVFTQVLTSWKPQVVHYHLLFRLSAGLPAITRSLGIPSFATLHDYWLLCNTGHMVDSLSRECTGPESYQKCASCLTGFKENPPRNAMANWVQNRQNACAKALANIDEPYSPSQYLADTHAQWGLIKPKVLPLGWLPINKVEPRTEGDIIFGFVGQIIGRKGLDVLVNAVQNLPAKGWQLKVWGKNYHPDFFNQAMHHIGKHPNLSYEGGYEPHDLPEIFAQIDVAVIPSRRENYPLTVLEAKSAGLPIVASKVGGVPEMLIDQEEGFIFESGNQQQLQQILARFINNRRLVNQLRANLAPVKTIAQNAAEYDALYRRALDNKQA